MRRFRPLMLLRTAALLSVVFLLAHFITTDGQVSGLETARSFVKTGLIFVVLPAALVAIALHQPTRRAIVRLAPLAGEEFDRLARYLRARLPRRRPQPQPQTACEEPVDPVPALLSSTKQRLDQLHRFLRESHRNCCRPSRNTARR